MATGDADVMITGGTEAPICPVGLGGFCAMKALSTRNDAPEKASRPFDLERDGFIMAEGAGMVVLEEMELAIRRGAHIYGEIAGIGFSGDAHHITAPPEDGHGAYDAMRIAIKDAGLRDSVKILLGGAPVNDEYAKEIGADFYGADPASGKNYLLSTLN